MAFIPCNNGGGATEHTATRSITTNGTTDLGVEHTYRYISTDVIPSGGLSCIADGPKVRSRTFYATRNYLYIWICSFVSYSTSIGWRGGTNVTISGSYRKFWNGGNRGQTNCGGVCAYNCTALGVVIGNNANVTISWNYSGDTDRCRDYLYQIPI